MFCARYRRLLVPYMECELDERARARIEAHVLRCPKCAAELELLRSVSGAIRSVGVPAMEPAPDLWARVSARIEQETASPARKPWVRVSQAASACAAAVLVGVIGISLVRTNSPQETGRPVYLNKNAVAVGSRAVAPSGARLPGTVAAPARSNRPRPTVSATAEDGPATALQRRVRAHTSEPLGGAEVDSAVPAPVSWRSDKAERAGGETRAHLAGPRKGEEAAERRSRFDLVAAVPASEESSVAVYAKASAAPKASDPTD
ncbi:MAG: anti-sigma factor family protein, partial [Armatimonadota bacterium]